MASNFCSSCGKSLGFIDRIAGGGLCGECKKTTATNRAQAQASFPARLKSALEDGVIEPWERAELDALVATGQIPADEVKRLSLALYEEARQKAVGDRVLTQAEYDYLARMQIELGISGAEIAGTLRELTRLRLLTEIRDGQLPEGNTAHVMLKVGEVCHLETEATLVEEKTISRTYVSDSTSRSQSAVRGASGTRGGFSSDALMKSFNVSTYQETANKEFVPVDTGTLTVTSQRVVFTGQREVAAIPIGKLVSVGLIGNRVRLAVDGRKSLHTFDVADGEMVAAVISRASWESQNATGTRAKAPRAAKPSKATAE